MCKRLIFLTSFVLVLALVSCVGAQSDPLAHYEFEGDYINSGTGTVAGQPRSGATIVADPGGGLKGASNVLKFYGNDEYVKIGNDDVGSITTALTVAAWVKSDGTNWSNAGIVTRGYNWRLYISGSANGTIQCMDTAPGSKARGSVNINEGEWHHVSGTYDGTQYILYIDGAQDGPAVPATGPIAQTTSHKFTVGAFESSGNVSMFYDGYIDDVRVYDEALDPMAIQALLEGDGATIVVDPNGDIAAANEIAMAGDTIEIAAGTFVLAEQIEIKDGVTYKGAGSALTIIDCGVVTRAFVGWGNRSQNDDLPYSETGYPDNTSGPKGWVIQGLSIIDGEADYVDKSVRRVGDPAIVPPLTANEILNPNKSTNGGGILLANYAEGSLIDVAFDQCYALATGVDAVDPTVTTYLGSGGAVYMGSATANILNCSFTNNNASSNGGAVRATNPNLENWDLSIESSTFTNNRCRDDGGAISTVRRNVSIINCVGDGNKTGLDPAIMADNVSSGAYGGFLWITGADKVAGTSYTTDTPPLEMTNYGGVVTVAGCTITNGEANRGGGIRSNSAAQLVVTDTSFTNCRATDNGGAIFANSPSPFNPAAFDPNDPNSSPVGDPGVYIDGVTIDGCIAEDDGGGINIDNWRTTSDNNYIEFPKVVISNTIVKNCRAGGPAPDSGNRDGGGILVNNRLDVTITNTLIENCTAGRHAAGIKIDGIVNTALIDRCQISNCTNDDISGEGGDGAAVYMDQDDNVGVMITNCIFNNNTNMQDDGVVRIDAQEAFFFNCTFVGNVAGDEGIIRFGQSKTNDPSAQNGVVNCLFVNNDHSPGSNELIAHSKNGAAYTYTNNGFFGNVGDNDELIDTIPDADLGLTANFIAATDPLVDTAGGDYHLAPGAEAIDAGTAEGAPDHDFDGAPRPQGAAHDVGAYEFSAN